MPRLGTRPLSVAASSNRQTLTRSHTISFEQLGPLAGLNDAQHRHLH